MDVCNLSFVGAALWVIAYFMHIKNIYLWLVLYTVSYFSIAIFDTLCWKNKNMTAETAAELIEDGSCVWLTAGGGGINEPSFFLKKLEERYLNTGHPCELTLCHSAGVGDKQGGGVDRFAHEGMVKEHWKNLESRIINGTLSMMWIQLTKHVSVPLKPWRSKNGRLPFLLRSI